MSNQSTTKADDQGLDFEVLETLSKDELIELLRAYEMSHRWRASRITELTQGRVVDRPRQEAEAIANRRLVRLTLKLAAPFEGTYRKARPSLARIRRVVRRVGRQK